jgi:uncharacterized membrane protein YphA (DoxX/SURF4 family)
MSQNHGGRCIGILIGLILLSTGLHHASNPFVFLNSLLAYRILVGLAADILAMILPWLQITIGLFILLGYFMRSGLLLAAFLFGLFLIAQVSALVRGLEIDCGCFAGFEQPVSSIGVMFLVILILLSLFCRRLLKETAPLFEGRIGNEIDQESGWGAKC